MIVFYVDYSSCVVGEGGDEGGTGWSEGCDLQCGGENGCGHGGVGQPWIRID